MLSLQQPVMSLCEKKICVHVYGRCQRWRHGDACARVAYRSDEPRVERVDGGELELLDMMIGQVAEDDGDDEIGALLHARATFVDLHHTRDVTR